MKLLAPILLALAGCAANVPATTVKSADGVTWRHNSESGTWTDPLGNTTSVDPRIPLCAEVTLKKDTRECVVRR